MDPDPDYLGLEIRASGGRFAGAARLFAGLRELSEFVGRIAGFPTDPLDEVIYVFGRPGTAGGSCSLRFFCVDGAGHTAIEIELEDDAQLYDRARAKFTLRAEPAAIDRFARELIALEAQGSGEAVLCCSGVS